MHISDNVTRRTHDIYMGRNWTKGVAQYPESRGAEEVWVDTRADKIAKLRFAAVAGVYGPSQRIAEALLLSGFSEEGRESCSKRGVSGKSLPN